MTKLGADEKNFDRLVKLSHTIEVYAKLNWSVKSSVKS